MQNKIIRTEHYKDSKKPIAWIPAEIKASKLGEEGSFPNAFAQNLNAFFGSHV